MPRYRSWKAFWPILASFRCTVRTERIGQVCATMSPRKLPHTQATYPLVLERKYEDGFCTPLKPSAGLAICKARPEISALAKESKEGSCLLILGGASHANRTTATMSTKSSQPRPPTRQRPRAPEGLIQARISNQMGALRYAIWRLLCSSFWVMTCFLIGGYDIPLKKELHRYEFGDHGAVTSEIPQASRLLFLRALHRKRPKWQI